MIRNVDPSAERFLADLSRIQETAERAARQISSGLRVTAPSDAPDHVGDILQLRANLSRNTQILANLYRAKTEADTAEKSLGHSITLLDRAIVLASQGASTIVTPESRKIIAGEVQGLLEQLVADSQTVAEGRYIFSGDRDQELAYRLNLASPTGVDRLFQTQASRRIEHPSGQTFQAAKTAQEIFDTRNPDDTPASDNVFAAVNGLRLALEADDQAGIEASMAALRRASERLNIEQSFYGAVQNKIEAAIEFGGKNNVLLETELSARQDADLTAAALELERTSIHEQAALAARARLPRTSLLDYLD